MTDTPNSTAPRPKPRSYRERVYGRYIEASAMEVAPATLSGRHDAAILDLGCGHGAIVHVARSLGYTNIGGVDGSPSQVAAAKRLGIEGVRLGDMFEVVRALPAASLDAAISFDVIEHLDREELIAFTDEIVRALKPGGRWIIHVPNGASPFGGAVLYGDLTHEIAFTPESITQLALSSGFTQVDCDEDAPVVHGVASFLRSLAWKAIRACLRFYLRAETGSVSQPILTQNFLAVLTK
ncbi:MAG: class I SAM-dependent methyltransferase [Alphaproteobacteria bacterium]|nr:class I SAM-dependent methyltransferase [Alphaproteobacteria bacterium]